jgi:hypothetical protein
MNPFKKLALELGQFAVDIRAKMNPQLKKLEPLEQQEVSEPIRDLLRAVKWGIEDAERMAETFEGKIEKLNQMSAAFEAEIGESAIAAGVAAKTIVKHSDHELALTAARDTAKAEGKTEAETEFNASLVKTNLIATRRAAAVTRVGALAAATLTDEQLSGEEHEAILTAIEGRIATLTEKNITAEGRPKIYAGLIAAVQNEEQFNTSLEVVLEAAGGELAAVVAPVTTPPPAKPSEKGPAGLAATGEKKKPVI